MSIQTIPRSCALSPVYIKLFRLVFIHFIKKLPEAFGIGICCTSKINCINGNNIPIETIEKTMENRILIKYHAMEDL